MGVVKVGGDGDCLFHALGYRDAYDGQALRIDIANFMTEHAGGQAAFQQEWQQESRKLRKGHWGGAAAIDSASG